METLGREALAPPAHPTDVRASSETVPLVTAYANLFVHFCCNRRLGVLARLFHVAVAGGAQLQERFRFFVETLAFAVVEDGFADDTVDLLRTEVVLIVEAVDHL